MPEELAAIILAAGTGTRLRPLTYLRPKALCPVGNVPLVDIAIAAAAPFADDVAVNVHHDRTLLIEHLNGRVGVSIEEPGALGSAGAVGKLRGWLDGRDVLILNADRYHPDDLLGLFEGWQRDTARLLVVADDSDPDFEGRWRFAGASLLPWRLARTLAAERSSLLERCWLPEREADRLELIPSDAPFVDCGTPQTYHRANMLASGGANVVAPDAIVDGEIERCVVWPLAHVRPGERLRDAIRAPGGITLYGIGEGSRTA